MSLAERLAEFPFFQDFAMEEIEQLSTFMEEKEYETDQMIIDEANPTVSMFFLLKGRVKVFKAINKASNFLTILEKPDIFGEVAFTDQQARSASASACEAVKVAELSHEHFDIIARQHPQLGIKFLQRLVRELSRKFRAIDAGVDVKSTDQTISDLIVSGETVKINTTDGIEYICKIKYADKSQLLPMLKLDMKGKTILVPFGQVKTISLADQFGKF